MSSTASKSTPTATSDRTTNQPRLVVGPTVHIRIGPSQPVIVRPASIVIGPAARQVIRVGPVSAFVGPTRAVTVEVPQRPAWDERGWRVEQRGQERVYSGWYQVTSRRAGERLRFEGRIVEHDRRVTPYIADPPVAIKRHPKAPCFTVSQAPWFEIHWRRPAANVDDALLYVERVLDEAINA